MLKLTKQDGDAVREAAKDAAAVLAKVGPESRTAAIVLFVQEAGKELESFDRAFSEMLTEAFRAARPMRSIPEPSIN